MSQIMEKTLLLCGIFFLPSVFCQESVIMKKPEAQIYNPKMVFPDEKLALKYRNTPPLELIIDVRNFSQSQMSNKEKKKIRKERIRKRKDKSGKYPRQRNKSQRPSNDQEKHVLRNNEKANLVRNRTIEILKNGLRILSAGESYSQNGTKSVNRVNETLLEKILSSATFKQDVLLSANSDYKLPVGFGIYETKTPLPVNHTLVPLPVENSDPQRHNTERHNKKHKIPKSDYDYDYDLLADIRADTNDSAKLYDSLDYESTSEDKSVGILLQEIVNALQNLTTCSNGSCTEKEKTHFEDPCEKWLSCRETLDKAFSGNHHDLPSCPCTYPSSVFYDEMIWDKKQKKYFRWRDASGETERLDIFKPGAAYCIRSLLMQGSLSVSSQQCCYDRSLKLLTRGSGAGTVNFISPDISRKLHYTVDILPWKLCKGDFTKYNIARNPNNGNDCPVHPNDQQYQLQVKLAKIF